MPTQTGAIPGTAHRLAERLYRAVLRAPAAARVEVVFPRTGADGTVAVERRRLLPLDLDRFRPATPASVAPTTYLDPARLLELLVAEHVFAELSRAAAEGFAAENAARLATMQRAHGSIDQRLEQLAGEARRLRQEMITSELLDLVAGTLAAKPPGRTARGIC
jgi:F-type H+-transporting ATPase subunit gamma